MDAKGDDFQSTIREKSKLKSKRRNKLSSKHRSKLKKGRDTNDKGDQDIFSPVSCTLSRKNTATDDDTGIIVISDESNDAAVEGNSERTGNSTQDAENSKSETNNTRKELSNDFEAQATSTENNKQLDRNKSEKEYIKKQSTNSSLIGQNSQTQQSKTDGKILDTSSPFLTCNTTLSNSAGKNVSPEITVNSSESKNLEEFSGGTSRDSNNDTSKFPKNLDCSPLSCFSFDFKAFSESGDTSVPNNKTSDLEYKNQDAEILEISQSSRHLMYKGDVSCDVFKQEEQNEIEGTALCSESRIRSLSLEHLNDCTPDEAQENTSEIRREGNVEKSDSNGIPSVSHSDPKNLLYSCPLCWKTFETSQSHTAHMKECAARNNLSTRQLLDALELQEKQFAERTALGLPDIPAVHVVKKPTAKRKTGAGKDSNLQLALALSVSLQEAEEKEQLQEDECLIEAGLGHEVVERQKTMLEKFGFTNSKPALPSTASRPKQGSKNKNKMTVLTQRTKEERERLITEKVAIILIGEDNDPASSTSKDTVQVYEHPVEGTNYLQKYETKSSCLWNAVTSSCDEEQSHYVKELTNLISPCKIKAGEKVKHLSQVPDRNVILASTDAAADDEKLCTSSSINEKSRNEPQSVPMERRQSPKGFFGEKETSNISFVDTLVNNWRGMLNKKAMSDVRIFVESEQEIPGHRLVFYARCRSILKDIVIEKGPGKSSAMLMWIDVSYRTALAFLQFIYSGLTSKILRLNEKDMLGLKELAQRYKVAELLEHLEVSAKVIKQSTPNASEFQRLGTPTKSVSPFKYDHTPQKSYQDNIVDKDISQHCSISLSKESSPVQKDKQSSYSPFRHSGQDKFKNATLLQENDMFAHLGENRQSNPSYFSPKSGHTSRFTEQNTNISYNHGEEMCKIHTSPVSKSQFENDMNSSTSTQNSIRSASPDLFMEEETEEKTQSPSSGLTQKSGVDIKYLLAMFDICLTQNKEKAFQEESPVKSRSISPSAGSYKNLSPALKNESFCSLPADRCMNNSEELAVKRSKSLLVHTPKTNDSANDNKEFASSSLFDNNKADSSEDQLKNNSEDIRSSQSMNVSELNKKDFDCIGFLENLISNSPSKTDADNVNSKRSYSKRDSSNESYRSTTKRICRESSSNELSSMSLQKIGQNELNDSKNRGSNIIDTLDLTQNSNKSDNSQSLSQGKSFSELEENHLSIIQNDSTNGPCTDNIIGYESKPESLNTPKIKNLKSGTALTTPIHETSGTEDKQQLGDWDSFDEMCNAEEPEIFSQGLSKLLSSQNISSNSEKHKSRNSSSSQSRKQISSSKSITSPCQEDNHTSQKRTDKVSLEDTLMACLNESIMWKDENAPLLKSSSKDRKSTILQEHNKYKTPTQQQKNVNSEDVTPPANYSAMKTPDLKKELQKYGLKTSLTKKQAKIMLRYIYDQLHPFITVSDSEDSGEVVDSGLPSSPFKIPDKNTRVPKSPTKKVNRSETSRSITGRRKNNRQNAIPVRRNLASQIDTGSDCDELSSQESSSSSTIDIAEEMLVEDLDGFDKEILGSQGACLSDDLPSVVESYIIGNPELHQKILQHEPIWLEEFHNDLKAQNYKFKMNHLMDYFDEQCITFRTLQGQKSRLRKRERKEARKKKSPKNKKKKISSSKSTAGCTTNSPNSSSN